jgi:hypothetical protein
VFVDGKDYLCGTKRGDTTIEKCQWSSKTEKSAARDLTFSTAIGLIFEYSPLFGGRAGERAIVEFMGSLGPKNAPISEWKDVALNDPLTEEKDTFWTVVTDGMSKKEFDEALYRIESGDPLMSNGLLMKRTTIVFHNRIPPHKTLK